MSPLAPGFASMRARRVRRLLENELGYRVVRQKGSHRRMESDHHRAITFAFHDGDSVGAALVRDILVHQVGLSLDEAKEIASRA